MTNLITQIIIGVIGLLIFYCIIKAAVKNGIIEARNHTDEINKPESPSTNEQIKLQEQFEKNEITFEQYKSQKKKLLEK